MYQPQLSKALNSSKSLRSIVSRPFRPKGTSVLPFFPRDRFKKEFAKHSQNGIWKCYQGPKGIGKTNAVIEALSGHTGVLPVWLPALKLEDLDEVGKLATEWKKQTDSPVTVFSDPLFKSEDSAEPSLPNPAVLNALKEFHAQGLLNLISTAETPEEAQLYEKCNATSRGSAISEFPEMPTEKLEYFLRYLSYNVNEVGTPEAKLTFTPPGTVIHKDHRYLFKSIYEVKVVTERFGSNLSQIDRWCSWILRNGPEYLSIILNKKIPVEYQNYCE